MMNLKITLVLLTIITGFVSDIPQTEVRIAQAEVRVLPDSKLRTGWYYLAENGKGHKLQLDEDTIHYFINPVPIVTAAHIATAEVYDNHWGGKGLAIRMNEKGIPLWSAATAKATGSYLAFVLNNRLLSVPGINAQITTGMSAVNRHNYSLQELEGFKKEIEKELH